MTTLCDLAQKLPDLVGALLDSEAKLKKGRFREETLTDVFTAALAAFAGPSLIIEYPDEAATGGDLDLDFWHVSTGRHLRLRIQAKRLNAETQNSRAVSINHRAYNELLHVVPSTGVLQFETLLTSAGSSIPLYMFYNHDSVVEDPYFAHALPALHGINLAFADDIAHELSAKLAAEPKRLHHKRLSHLRPHFFPLSTILCAPVKPGDEVPSPDEVHASLLERWSDPARKTAEAAIGAKAARFIRRWQDLRVSEEGGRRPADGPAIRLGSRVQRATITFISGRTGDERTPKILD